MNFIKTAVSFAALGVAAFAVAEMKASKGNTKEVPDVIILLGHKLENNKADETLELRMDAAAEYLKKNEDVLAIVCGGILSEEQIISEAEVMYEGLVSRGIEKDRIILENKSKTTRENFLNAKEIMSDMKFGFTPKVALLSSSYHLLRARALAKTCGLDVTTLAAETPRNIRLKCYIREFICLPELLLIKLGVR